nr:MAG TPA: hypothetical protein [Caudoviricetes sp.]
MKYKVVMSSDGSAVNSSIRLTLQDEFMTLMRSHRL